MSGEGASWPPDYCRLVFIDGDGLTEAGISLSATRFAGVAAAVLPRFNLDEIVFYDEAYLLAPGHSDAKICQKIFRARPYNPRPPRIN